jgi:ribosomal protein S18 acetylase RimI-like enzyme
MLYRVQKRDVMQASKVLADAFQHDPLWNKIYEGDPNIVKRFQGVMGLVPGKYADMNWWRSIRSGTMSVGMRMGLSAAMKMGTILKPITADRRGNMAGCTFLYVLVIGVATEQQGKGFGRKLIDAAIEKAEQEGLHLYLETEAEENVRMYEHFGFRLLKRITLPMVDLPMWEMVKEPQA